MAKDEPVNQLNLTVVALVALVAIVGLVALVMNAASTKAPKIAIGSQIVSAENVAGDARRRSVSTQPNYPTVDCGSEFKGSDGHAYYIFAIYDMNPEVPQYNNVAQVGWCKDNLCGKQFRDNTGFAKVGDAIGASGYVVKSIKAGSWCSTNAYFGNLPSSATLGYATTRSGVSASGPTTQ